MSEKVIGPFPTITRFRLDELREEDGSPAVLLLLEATTTKGDVQRIEGTMSPESAIRNGKALGEIGAALASNRH